VDIFSFAMVVYEIICREVPFEEEAPVTFMISIGSLPCNSMLHEYFCHRMLF